MSANDPSRVMQNPAYHHQLYQHCYYQMETESAGGYNYWNTCSYDALPPMPPPPPPQPQPLAQSLPPPSHESMQQFQGFCYRSEQLAHQHRTPQMTTVQHPPPPPPQMTTMQHPPPPQPPPQPLPPSPLQQPTAACSPTDQGRTGKATRGGHQRREHRRTETLNRAFDCLRNCIPHIPRDTKMSKKRILQLAIQYIGALNTMLACEQDMDSLKLLAEASMTNR